MTADFTVGIFIGLTYFRFSSLDLGGIGQSPVEVNSFPGRSGERFVNVGGQADDHVKRVDRGNVFEIFRLAFREINSFFCEELKRSSINRLRLKPCTFENYIW